MTTIIAGSRAITSFSLMEEAASRAPFKISRIYCGMAPGGDTLGWTYGNMHDIPVDFFPAKWETEGKAAGILRNQRMIDAGAQALLALWDGHSSGTKDMIDRAIKAGLAVYVVTAMPIWTIMKEEVWPPREGTINRVVEPGASQRSNTTS